jgi:hypothetical protein
MFEVREDSVIDHAKRSMCLRGNNVTMFNSVHMYEECEYRQHPDNPQWTIKEQIAYLDIGVPHSLPAAPPLCSPLCSPLYSPLYSPLIHYIVYCRSHLCWGLKKGIENFARGLFVSRANNASKDEIDLIAASHKPTSPHSSPHTPSLHAKS